MADYRSLFMQPDAAQQRTPRGGLAPEERGGLSKFMGDVARGIETVMSSPIYQRLWSGAVSGQTGDPMAGPVALESLRNANQPSLQDELAYYRIRQMQRSEEDDERQRRARESVYSDPRNIDDATMAQAFPSEWARQRLKPPPQPKAPILKPVMTPEGPKYVPAEEASGMTPYSLVNINNGPDGLDLNQVANASRAERASFVESMKPFEAFDRAKTTMRNVRSMADERGVLPQQASQIIASDAMAALRPEALNEGDVARLTAVGLWNKAFAALGLPPQMTVEQLDTLSKMIDDKAREAEPRRRAIIEDGRFRAQQFGFDPRLILGPYATDTPASQPAAPTPSKAPTPVRARLLP